MANLFQNSAGEISEHPPREMLLLFVDGELQAKETAQLESHLEACWPCRVKTQKIQEAIADIIEFDEEVITARVVPPGRWRDFYRQLTDLVATSGKQSLGSRLVGTLSRFFPIARFANVVSLQLRPWFRPLVALSLLIAIAALVFTFIHEPTVSASQLLSNSIAGDAREIGSTSAAVVHQTLVMRRKDQSHEEKIGVEIWNDTRNSRVRHFLTDDQSITEKPSTPTLFDEVEEVLKANHMNPSLPLSALSYQSWRNTLLQPRDEVAKSKFVNGSEVLTLHTMSSTSVQIGQIEEAVLVVTASEWRPVELRLNVLSEGGKKVYELTQTFSEVVSLEKVEAAIFGHPQLAALLPAAGPTESIKREDPQIAAAIPAPRLVTPSLAATAELEIEALNILNQVGADLGEQISVKRVAGVLEIAGIVESDQRKAEIAKALSSMSRNASVRVDIETVAEAVSKQSSNKPIPSPSTLAVEITGNKMAAESEVRAYFANQSKDVDESVRRYAERMISLSVRGMDHLWAMKRLLNQFTPEEIASLSPDERTKWMELIRSHSRSYQRNTKSLRSELQPVFFSALSVRPSFSAATVVDAKEMSRLVNQLFEAGAANDRAIRSAFTSSSSVQGASVIKTSQFWESLENAESLAARIGGKE